MQKAQENGKLRARLLPTSLTLATPSYFGEDVREAGLGFVLTLIVLFTVLVWMSSGQSAAPLTTAGVASTPRPTPVAQPSQAVPTVAASAVASTPSVSATSIASTVRPLPTASATAVTRPSDVGPEGTRTESHGLALTVIGHREIPALGQATIAPGDTTFLLVEVVVENVNRTRASISSDSFKLRNADGFFYIPTVTNDASSANSPMLPATTLAAGEKARGTVAFLVPKSPIGLVLTFQSFSLSESSAIIQVAVGSGSL